MPHDIIVIYLVSLYNGKSLKRELVILWAPGCIFKYNNI